MFDAEADGARGAVGGDGDFDPDLLAFFERGHFGGIWDEEEDGLAEHRGLPTIDVCLHQLTAIVGCGDGDQLAVPRFKMSQLG